MLADQLLDPAFDLSEMGEVGTALYLGTLKKAQKFALDRSIGEVAGDMPRPAVRDVLPFCRLPYPTCWIEIAQQDRPFFAEAFTQGPNHSGGRTFQPQRVGILCEQQGDNPQRFYATLAWTYSTADALIQGLDHAGALCPWGLSIWCDERDPELDEPFLVKVLPTPYHRDTLAKIGAGAPDMLALLRKNADHDWAGEPWFWLAALALLNAKNGATAEFRPAPEKLNRARAKAGKPPLADFHHLTLRIGPTGRKTGRMTASDRATMKAHTVRGHFKVRRTGIYWWRPFVRGDMAEGFAAKRYKVKV